MSVGDTPELTKSWVVVDNKNIPEDVNNKVQDVVETEPLQDSDTDSISVISESESGVSYRTDEEEIFATTSNETENKVEEPEAVPEPVETETKEENQTVEKLLYFATSAVCAFILIGVSVAVQQYLQGTSEVDTFTPDKPYTPPYVEVRNSHKRKSELKNKILKQQDGIAQIEDNDLTVEANLKSNYKQNKNKRAAMKCNKENCDVTVSRGDENDPSIEDETYNKKIEELKVKEDYLREKEKFLIEKEHNLLKKEIKLNVEKNKYEKKEEQKKDEKENYKKNKFENEEHRNYHKKSKINDLDEDKINDKNRCKKFKQDKKNEEPKVNTDEPNSKNYKRNKHTEERKQNSAQKRQKYPNDQKKRNISGQWYINLHEGRDNLRQKKRSFYKRNKAHWYFQWMVDRARLRVK